MVSERSGFHVPLWGWLLLAGLALVGVQAFAKIAGLTGASIETAGGLGLIAGSCEALILSTEGISARLGWNKFVGGTIAAVVSNIPEIALLGFFVAKDPTMAFVIGLMSVYTNSMAFAIYTVALPKDRRGAASIPPAIVRLGTDLLSFGGGLCLVLAGTMIVVHEFQSPVHTIGVPELYIIGFALLAVFATFLIGLVRHFSVEENQSAEDHGDPPPPAMPALLGLMAIGVAGSFVGGHALSDLGDFIVAAAPGLAPMQVALIMAIIAGIPTYIIVINAHRKRQSLIALSNTFGGLTQNLFNVMAFCCLLIAAFNSLGILHGQTVPITTSTTLSVLFIYPAYRTIGRAIEDDGQFNWTEIVSLVALLGFLMFILTRDGG
jgi:hypothetical protein